jgi:hypothetical protein
MVINLQEVKPKVGTLMLNDISGPVSPLLMNSTYAMRVSSARKSQNGGGKSKNNLKDLSGVRNLG